jgi:hypothetical protein
VIVAQGDGWIRSFEAATGRPIWEFDINFKESLYSNGGHSTRNYVLATPVLYEGRVYVASGQQAEHGEGLGRLVCIDPSKTGDISSELAVDDRGNVLAQRRTQAVDFEKGEKAIPNSNSGLVWDFTSIVDGEEFVDTMHRTLSTVAIHDELVIAPDFSGLVHCLDARTGKKHWSYDMFAALWASPLIVGKHVYIADEDGELAVFRLAADAADVRPITEIAFDEPIYSSPIFANGVLYIATRQMLYAIAEPVPDAGEQPGKCGTPDDSRPVAPSDDDAQIRAAKPIFAPTPQDVVEQMLELAEVGADETVVDLGSGDGRIVIAAAQHHGARAIGYEIDSALVRASQAAAAQAGVAELVTIKRQDMYAAELTKAHVVTLFLYPDALRKLRPQFAQMKPGAKIISHHYAIPGATPDRVVLFASKETGNEHRVILYTTPLSYEAE